MQNNSPTAVGGYIKDIIVSHYQVEFYVVLLCKDEWIGLLKCGKSTGSPPKFMTLNTCKSSEDSLFYMKLGRS